MNLALATLVPGLLLVAAGVPLALAHGRTRVLLTAFPRSPRAAKVFFGLGAGWFLWKIWNLSPADLGEYHLPLFGAFAAVAVLAFKYAPDFLAVRGLCVIVLLAAMPLLRAGYMNYDHPQVYLQKSLIYVCIGLAIWLGAQPWRLRDFFSWLFFRPARVRGCGWLLAAYGCLLCVTAFSSGVAGG